MLNENPFCRELMSLWQNTAGIFLTETHLLQLLSGGLDSLVERNRQILTLKTAKIRDISSLKHWIEGNACITREESAYLLQREDLLSTTSLSDDAVANVEAWLEDRIVQCWKDYREVSKPQKALHWGADSESLLTRIGPSFRFTTYQETQTCTSRQALF